MSDANGVGKLQLEVALGTLGILIGGALLIRQARQAGSIAAARAADVAALRVANADLDIARRDTEAQAAQLRATLAGMSDGVMMVDARMRLVQWNAQFAEIVGVPERVLRVGTPMADILRAQAEAGEFGPLEGQEAIEAVVTARMARLTATRDVGVAERTRPNGRVAEIRRTMLPNGGFVTLYADITVRKQAEAAERAAAAAAAEAVRQRQQFVTIVSHELRVPLDAVMTSLELVDDAILPAAARALVATARRAGSGLRDLVSDILDLSRLDAGRLVLRNADFNLPQLLGEACAMFHAAAAAKGLTPMVLVDAGVPEVMHGDAGRIRQVLTNLLSNAVKYASPGVVTVRAAVAGRALRLTVADPGPAIPPAQAANLFQPFSRLDAAEFGREKGTGLGLSICARLATAMGGEMGLAREGGGNAFWLSLPIDPAHGDQGLTAETAARRRTRRASLLLVEDVASNRELTAALLRREGHRVALAADGYAAIDLAASHMFDLVLMDIHMPGIDGVETARRIRALAGPAGKVPIIALTGTSSSEERMARVEGAMDAVLMKPVRPDDLMAMLRRFVDPWLPDARDATGAVVVPPGVLDAERVAALRDGLAPGMFARLMEQCVVDMEERVPGLSSPLPENAPAVRMAAHALAGMAGSYGLAAFEGRMREIIRAVDGGDHGEAHRLVGDVGDMLATGAMALRVSMQRP